MIISLDNIRILQRKYSLISKTKIRGNNSRPHYRLDKELRIKLSNDKIITIHQGFTWDLSSVPRIFWALLPPDGDFELAYLIHDYLYICKQSSREFADDEMYKWAVRTNGTKNWSIRNIDNKIRYWGVRAFGWLVWKKIINLK